MTMWTELGIEPTDDPNVIKRAYARCLKLRRPEDDPDGFARLRQAYEQALAARRDAREIADRSTEAVEQRGNRVDLRKHEPPDAAPDAARDAASAQWPIDAVLDRLISTPVDSRSTVLRAMLRNSAFDRLDQRELFAEKLLFALERNFGNWWPLLPVLAEVFGWPSPDSLDQRDSPAAHLEHRWHGRAWRVEAERSAGEPIREKALRLLSAAVDEPAFRRFSRSRHGLEMMSSLLYDLPRDLRHHDDHGLDPGAVSWWQKWIAARPITLKQWLAGLWIGAVCGVTLIGVGEIMSEQLHYDSPTVVCLAPIPVGMVLVPLIFWLSWRRRLAALAGV